MKAAFVTTCLSVFLTHCVSAPKPKRYIDPQDNLSSTEAQPQAAMTASSFFLKHSRSNQSFSETDKKFLNEMASAPETGSIEEAALVVGINKLALSLIPAAGDYADPGTIPSNTEAPQIDTGLQEVSLEALFLEKQINLSQSLVSNDLLQNFSIFRQIRDALNKTNNSDEFNARTREAMNQIATGWASESIATNDDPMLSVDPSDVSGPGISTSIADLRSGDNLLMEAIALAENRQFRDAILKASQITPTNPLFDSAQQKIVTFSNDAVQILRQKAAQAFQNAIPVADPKARAAYLEEAKLHLEEALSNYPKAPSAQLSTVRENLAVISRDLDRIDDSSGMD